MPHDPALRLPVVRFRCDQRFDALAATGTPGQGFCGQCQKNVHDFRGRSAAHIRAVHRAEIAAGRGTPCGAYDRLFVETPLPPQPGPWRVRWTGWLAALGLGAPLGLAGCATERIAAPPTFVSAVDPLSIQTAQCSKQHVFVTSISDSTKLTGRILDEAGEGLPGATVSLTGTVFGAVTDMDGNFMMVQLAALVGTEPFRIQIEAVGYRTIQTEATVGQHITADLHLDSDSDRIAYVVGFVDLDNYRTYDPSRGGVDVSTMWGGMGSVRRTYFPFDR